MATVMASQPAVGRRPFGEISASRLQEITSIKNRQNLASSSDLKSSKLTSTPKRKAEATFEIFTDNFCDDDSENVDPNPSKRAKSSNSCFDFNKPCFVTKASNTSVSQRKIAIPKSRPSSSNKENSRSVKKAINIQNLFPEKKNLKRTSFSIVEDNTAPAKKARATSSFPSRVSAPKPRLPSSQRLMSSRLSTTPTPQSATIAFPSSTFDIDGFAIPFLPSSLPTTKSTFKLSRPSTDLYPSTLGSSFTIYEDSPEEELDNLMGAQALMMRLESEKEQMEREKEERDVGKENRSPSPEVDEEMRGGRLTPGMMSPRRRALGELKVVESEEGYEVLAKDEKEVEEDEKKVEDKKVEVVVVVEEDVVVSDSSDSESESEKEIVVPADLPASKKDLFN